MSMALYWLAGGLRREWPEAGECAPIVCSILRTPLYVRIAAKLLLSNPGTGSAEPAWCDGRHHRGTSEVRAEYKRNTSGIRAEHKRNTSDQRASSSQPPALPRAVPSLPPSYHQHGLKLPIRSTLACRAFEAPNRDQPCGFRPAEWNSSQALELEH